MRRGDRLPEYECVFCAHRFRRLNRRNPHKCPACGRGNKVDHPTLERHGRYQGTLTFFWEPNMTRAKVRSGICEYLKAHPKAPSGRIARYLGAPEHIVAILRAEVTKPQVKNQTNFKIKNEEAEIDCPGQLVMFE